MAGFSWAIQKALLHAFECTITSSCTLSMNSDSLTWPIFLSVSVAQTEPPWKMECQRGTEFIKLDSGQVCSHFLDCWLIWERAPPCGQCHHWAGGPGLHREAGWVSHSEQARKQHFFHSLYSCLEVQALSFLVSLMMDWCLPLVSVLPQLRSRWGYPVSTSYKSFQWLPNILESWQIIIYLTILPLDE